MHAEATKDGRRDDEDAHDGSEHPWRAWPQRRGKGEVEPNGGAGRGHDGPARLGAFDVRGVAQHARAYGAARLLARGNSRSAMRHEIRVLRVALEECLHVWTAGNDLH